MVGQGCKRYWSSLQPRECRKQCCTHTARIQYVPLRCTSPLPLSRKSIAAFTVLGLVEMNTWLTRRPVGLQPAAASRRCRPVLSRGMCRASAEAVRLWRRSPGTADVDVMMKVVLTYCTLPPSVPRYPGWSKAAAYADSAWCCYMCLPVWGCGHFKTKSCRHHTNCSRGAAHRLTVLRGASGGTISDAADAVLLPLPTQVTR